MHKTQYLLKKPSLALTIRSSTSLTFPKVYKLKKKKQFSPFFYGFKVQNILITEMTCSCIAWFTRMSSEMVWLRWIVHLFQLSATIASKNKAILKTLHNTDTHHKSIIFALIPFPFTASQTPQIRRRFAFRAFHFVFSRDARRRSVNFSLRSRRDYHVTWVLELDELTCVWWWRRVLRLSSVKRESCSGGTVRGRTQSWTVGSYVARSECWLLVIQVRLSLKSTLFCYQFCFLLIL